MTSSFKDAVLTPDPEIQETHLVEVASPHEAINFIQSHTSTHATVTPSTTYANPVMRRHEIGQSLYNIARDVINRCRTYYSQFGFMDTNIETSSHKMACHLIKSIKLEASAEMGGNGYDEDATLHDE